MNPQNPADVDNDDLQEDSLSAESPQAERSGSRGGEATDDAAEQAQQLSDKLLRLQAELDNVRKRSAREASDARRYAAAGLLADLLGVLDNMQRAVAAAKESSGGDSLVDGFALVTQLLQEVLARHGCVKIEALGQPFDPNHHEAIGQQPSDDQPPGTVLMVVQDGFQLHDRVLRPTRVIIAAHPAAGASNVDHK